MLKFNCCKTSSCLSKTLGIANRPFPAVSFRFNARALSIAAVWIPLPVRKKRSSFDRNTWWKSAKCVISKARSFLCKFHNPRMLPSLFLSNAIKLQFGISWKSGSAKAMLITLMRKSGYFSRTALIAGTHIAISPKAEIRKKAICGTVDFKILFLGLVKNRVQVVVVVHFHLLVHFHKLFTLFDIGK